MIAGWAINRTFRSLGMLFPLVTRALPLLLLFITFLFINTEVWMVADSLSQGVLALAMMFFAAMAVGFLLVRLPEEMDRVDDDTDTGRLVERTRGTPVEGCSAEVFDEIPQEDLRGVLEVGASPRATLGLVAAARASALLHGRDHVLPSDVQALAVDVMAHRLVLGFDAVADGVRTRDVVDQVLRVVPPPVPNLLR